MLAVEKPLSKILC